MNLPIDYTKLTPSQRREVRLKYIDLQEGKCYWCKEPLNKAPKQDKKINWSLFPSGFRNHPIHLQHCHDTGMTEGAVHMYCNAVMWQYHGK